MIVLLIAVLACSVPAALVVGYVAVEARRDGRDLFTPQGEQILADVRRRGDHLRDRGEALRQKTADAVSRRSAS
ncbi:hypothetical protein [Ornithinicoccus hortensis]|uniref:Uncharacterized protein n=1 Tax=Ornithinicoccus hortensis TaxID=82346 RepID=A0A542YRM9_9MICO|nr:hypothetical protein [Ornithinicoccus hortensis]TQL50740.1 hypothetical protein FB467_1857 [Ornithinicoccus hortensis]